MQVLRKRRPHARVIGPSVLFATLSLMSSAGCIDEGDGEIPKLLGAAGSGATLGSGGGIKSTAGSTSEGGGSAGTQNSGGKAGGRSRGGRGGQEEGGSTGDGGTSANPQCGNKVVDSAEECDDGNLINGDGCSATCTNKCEACNKTLCSKDPEYQALWSSCFASDKVAEDGPAEGTAWDELCSDLIGCVRQSGCLSVGLDNSFGPCYCGTATEQECNNGMPKGPCVVQMQAAGESVKTGELQALAKNPTKALGAATILTGDCDRDACGPECFENRDKNACERCSVGPEPFMDLASTVTCVDTCQDADPSVRAACESVVTCVQTSKCGLKNLKDCYANGTGACADKIRAAARTENSAEVALRWDQFGNPLNSAVQRLSCQLEHCRTECFGATGNGGSGGAGGMGGTSGQAGSGGTTGEAGKGGTNASGAGGSANAGSSGSGGGPDCSALECANKLTGDAVGLCVQTVNCMLDKQCAQKQAVDCYCGSAVGPACFSSPNGKCKAEFEAAAGTNVASQVFQRMAEEGALAAAKTRLDCAFGR